MSIKGAVSHVVMNSYTVHGVPVKIWISISLHIFVYLPLEFICVFAI